MKTILKKITISFLMGNLVIFNSIFSQELKAELSVVDTHISSLGVIEYSIKIINLTDKEVFLNQPWNSFVKPVLEYRNNIDSIWTPLKHSAYKARPFLIPAYESPYHQNRISLSKTDSMQSSFHWAPFLEKKEFLKYSEHKRIFLRTKFYTEINQNPIISNEVEINFSLHEEESEVFRWLKNKSIPGFMYEILVFGPNAWGLYTLQNLETIKYAEELIQNFPSTRFNDWAKLHLAFYYYTGVFDNLNKPPKPDYEKVKILLEELKDTESEYIRKIRLVLLNEVDFDPFRE